MFHLFSKSRFHESIACAVLLAGSVTLHAMWIVNLFAMRLPYFRERLSLLPSVGPLSGMYLKAVGVFVLVFLVSGWYWRGKDCSHQRLHLLKIFLFSTLTFFVMTLPFVYSFSILVE